jgi:hypothetical protein
MTNLSIGIAVLLLTSGSAFAEGVNDRMPNGQQGYYYQPSQPPGGSYTTPTRSGAYYQQQFYAQQRSYSTPPRVRGIDGRVYRYRR